MFINFVKVISKVLSNLDKVSVELVSKEKRSRLLRALAKIIKEKYVSWLKEYMKINFITVIFSDESNVVSDGPDG